MSEHRIDTLPLRIVLERMGVSQRQVEGHSKHFSQSGISRISHKILGELAYEQAADIAKAIAAAIKAKHPILTVRAEVTRKENGEVGNITIFME